MKTIYYLSILACCIGIVHAEPSMIQLDAGQELEQIEQEISTEQTNNQESLDVPMLITILTALLLHDVDHANNAELNQALVNALAALIIVLLDQLNTEESCPVGLLSDDE